MWKVLYVINFLLTKVKSANEDIGVMNANEKDAVPPRHSASMLGAWPKMNLLFIGKGFIWAQLSGSELRVLRLEKNTLETFYC